MDNEVREIIREAWCVGGHKNSSEDTFGAFLTRAAEAIYNAGYRKVVKARKYPSELNTRLIRINLGDYALLMDISRRDGVTVAETLHTAISNKQEVI